MKAKLHQIDSTWMNSSRSLRTGFLPASSTTSTHPRAGRRTSCAYSGGPGQLRPPHPPQAEAPDGRFRAEAGSRIGMRCVPASYITENPPSIGIYINPDMIYAARMGRRCKNLHPP